MPPFHPCHLFLNFLRQNEQKNTHLSQFSAGLGGRNGGGYTGYGRLYIPPHRENELMTKLDAALRYIDHGLAVIPLWPDRRKNPKLTSYTEYLERLPTREEWTRWAARWPNCNIGAITGYWLNYVCLDFDDLESYKLWADGGHHLAGQTWTVRTSRGYHVWFQVGDDPGQSRSYIKGQAEVLLRARGGYCIVPPSIHWTGVRYSTTHRCPPLKIDSILDVLEGWTEKKQTKTKAATPRPKPGPGRISPMIRIEELVPPVRDTPNGRGAYLAQCPFQNNHKQKDTHPSAWINIQQQRFGCNACWPGQWFDVYNVYAMLNGITNAEAYRRLKGRPD